MVLDCQSTSRSLVITLDRVSGASQYLKSSFVSTSKTLHSKKMMLPLYFPPYCLYAPVSGGEQGAINGTLSIMVGGDAKIFERCRPILEAMGKSIIHVGPNSMGQTVKLMNQILVAGTLNAVVEALIFAQKAGVDLEKALEAVKGGAAGSWQLSNLAPRIIRRDFRPGFMVDLIQKDLRLVMGAAEVVKTPLPVTSFIHQMYYSLQSAGEGRDGTQALVKVLERITGVEVKQDK